MTIGGHCKGCSGGKRSPRKSWGVVAGGEGLEIPGPAQPACTSRSDGNRDYCTSAGVESEDRVQGTPSWPAKQARGGGGGGGGEGNKARGVGGSQTLEFFDNQLENYIHFYQVGEECFCTIG